MNGRLFQAARSAAALLALLTGFLSLVDSLAVGQEAVSADAARRVLATPGPPSTDRPDDEVWYVSTRSLPCPKSVSGDFAPRVGHYHYAEGWQSSDFTTLVNSPMQLTVIYVHGNRMTHSDAIRRGWHVYDALVSSATQPIRYIIWSWPSEQIPHHPLRDVRIKAYRAQTEGIYLARYLNELPEHTQKPTSLIGYSYGARVIGGALHVLGGGTIDGAGLNRDKAPTEHWLRAALMAPAIDRDAFAPGNLFQYAPGVVQQPLVLFNPCDPVLKRYRFINRCTREEAMGFRGIAANGGLTVTQINVSGYIGRTHDERRYLDSPSIMAAVREYVLWNETSGEQEVPAEQDSSAEVEAHR